MNKTQRMIDFMMRHGGYKSVLTDLENKLVSAWGNKDNVLINPNDVTIGAGTNTFTYPVFRTDSGTAAMVTITVPYTSFQGKITIFPGGAFTWTAAGNISILGTAILGRMLEFYYNPVTAKWYPSYV